MKDTLCLHKHFSPSPRAMNSKFKILSMFIIFCNHLSHDTAPQNIHTTFIIFCAEKATLSLLISIYLSVYGLFTPVCCVVWKVLYKRGKAVSTIHRTTVVLYTCIALGNCCHSSPQSMWQWPGRLATAAVDQLHETCHNWLRGIFGLVGWGTELFP